MGGSNSSHTLRLRPHLRGQISEFSLILASLCLQAGYFSQENFTAVTIACVLTLIISGLGHEVPLPRSTPGRALPARMCSRCFVSPRVAEPALPLPPYVPQVLHLAFERFGRGWLKCLDARGEKHVDHGGHSGHIVVFGMSCAACCHPHLPVPCAR